MDGDRALPIRLDDGSRAGVRALAGDPALLERVRAWAAGQPGDDWLGLAACTLGPSLPDPGAIYTIGLNYRAPGEAPGSGPDQPLVYGKAVSLHPAIVLLAVPIGNALAGIVGMFLVVPVAGVIATTWRAVLQTISGDADEPAPLDSTEPDEEVGPAVPGVVVGG